MPGSNEEWIWYEKEVEFQIKQKICLKHILVHVFSLWAVMKMRVSEAENKYPKEQAAEMTSFHLGIAELLTFWMLALLGKGISFSEPANGFKVSAERGKTESIVTAVLWSTVLFCFFPKVPVYVSQPLYCLFKNWASWPEATVKLHC